MARSNKQPSTQASPSHTPAPVSNPNAVVAREARPTEEQIARRAYELFLQRGGTHGNHVDDWIQAERELSLSRRA